MTADRELSRVRWLRESRDAAADLVIRGWFGFDTGDRAAMLVAQDDPGRAALVGGAPFTELFQEDIGAVLDHARDPSRASAACEVAEAYALFMAGGSGPGSTP